MGDARSRLRAALEHALPWFDREAEDRWKAGFERDMAASRAVREEAAVIIGRDDVMRGSFARGGARLVR